MKEIKLTQDKVALVDDEDYDELMKYKWCAVKGRDGRTYYATHRCKDSNLDLIHRFILRPNIGELIDHEDHNGLNNQRYNIHACDHKHNSQNQVPARKRNNTSSVYKGVAYDRNRDNWSANLMYKGIRYRLGRFNSEINAHLVYENKIKELKGEANDSSFMVQD